MESNQTKNESSWHQLMYLMNSQLSNIIRREHENETRICLYGFGTYWSAFEKSAFLLCQIFPESHIFITTHIASPFPVVMAIISDDQLRDYGRHHIFCRDYPDYKELFCLKPSTIQYRVWHRNEMNKFSQVIDSTRQKKA